MYPIRMITLTAFLATLLSPGLFGQIFTQPLFSDGGGYLGVQVRDITASEVPSLGLPAERGVFVIRANEGSPAAAAGLKEGDVILEFAQFPVVSVRQFQRLVSETPPGRTVRISLMRQGSRQELEATVGERRQAGGFSMAPGLRIPGFRELPAPGPLQGEVHTPPRLGIGAEPVTPQLAESLGVASGGGLLVMEVHEGSPAQEAGLKAGDVITSVNGHPIRNLNDLIPLLDSGSLQIEIVRDRKTRTVTAEIKSGVDEGESPMRL